MRKYSLIFILIALSILVGCDKKADDSAYKVYYLNMDATSVLEEGYNPSSTDLPAEELAAELLGRLQGEPGTATLRQSIPSDMKCSCMVSGYLINVDFDSKFYDMTVVEQTLISAAVVRTLIQVPGCSYVNITVDNEPLIMGDDYVVGSMNEDSFVENPGAQINSKQSTDITLYFADAKDPTKLRKKTESITYTNKTLEKVVMEKLIEGPSSFDGMKGTVPAGTKIITSSIYDGVCYINLNDAFINNQDNEITEQVVLYSIVDSLCSLEDVTKVQITVNGETTGKIRYNYELSTLYEMDESIVVDELQDEDSTEIIQPTEEVDNDK